MRYKAVAVMNHDEDGYKLRFVVRGPSMSFGGYGRVYRYVMNDVGCVRVFDSEEQAWGVAAAYSRGQAPNYN